MKIKPLDRLDNPTIEEFQHYIKEDKPVIITGVANQWVACSRWSPENFKKIFGEILVPLRPSDNEIEVLFGDAHQKDYWSFFDYIDLITSNNQPEIRRPYLGNIDFDDPLAKEILAPIRYDFNFPNYFPNSDINKNSIHFWLGAANQKSTIHNDTYHNLNAQIYGKKAFLLFAPQQHELLYTVQWDPELWASPIDPQNPDLEKYPLFKQAEALEAILSPGEILFIPAFWWHQARSVSTSINVNMWSFTERVTEYWDENHPAFRKKVNK